MKFSSVVSRPDGSKDEKPRGLVGTVSQVYQSEDQTPRFRVRWTYNNQPINPFSTGVPMEGPFADVRPGQEFRLVPYE